MALERGEAERATLLQSVPGPAEECEKVAAVLPNAIVALSLDRRPRKRDAAPSG